MELNHVILETPSFVFFIHVCYLRRMLEGRPLASQLSQGARLLYQNAWILVQAAAPHSSFLLTQPLACRGGG